MSLGKDSIKRAADADAKKPTARKTAAAKKAPAAETAPSVNTAPAETNSAAETASAAKKPAANPAGIVRLTEELPVYLL